MKLALLKEKLPQIDEHISQKEKDKALHLIDDVLEFEPFNSQIHWKKLLAKAGCKDEYELLKSGYILQDNPAFENAKKYADDSEKQTYESIEKTKESINKFLEVELAKRETEDKRKTGVKEKLIEYRQKADDLQKVVQKNINRLEEIEKSIHEYVIDCTVIAGEYEYAVEHLHSETKRLGDIYYKSEISEDKKEVLEIKLDIIETDCLIEFNKFEQLKLSNPKFLEYFRLFKEQEAICQEINQNKADLENLKSEIKRFSNTIDEITKKYAEARMDIYNSRYASSVTLLSQIRFEEIIKESFERRI